MFHAAARRPSGFIFAGLLLQVVGLIIASTSFFGHNSAGVARLDARGTIAGAVIVVVGIWPMAVGLIGVGVRSLVTPEALRSPPPVSRPYVAPATGDPADLAHDPDPFGPHEGDSSVVADVRRACDNGAPRSVARILSRAEQKQPLSEPDRTMVDSLLTEAARRPLGPLRNR